MFRYLIKYLNWLLYPLFWFRSGIIYVIVIIVWFVKSSPSLSPPSPNLSENGPDVLEDYYSIYHISLSFEIYAYMWIKMTKSHPQPCTNSNILLKIFHTNRNSFCQNWQQNFILKFFIVNVFLQSYSVDLRIHNSLYR